MTTEEAFILIKKVKDSQWKDWLDSLTEIITISNNLIVDRAIRVQYFENERLHMSNLLIQKILLHGASILHNSFGINYPSKYSIDMKIKDPFSLNVLLRSLLESYLTLRYLNFASSDSENEFRFKLWTQYGLKQRGKINFYSLSDEHNLVDLEQKQAIQKQLDSEKQNILDLENEIKSSDIFKNLAQDKQTTFLDQISHHWRFGFKDNTYIKYSWQDLLNNSGANPFLYDNFYNFLSWPAHSTSLSLYQLRDLYKEFQDLNETSNVLKDSTILIAFSIVDYIKTDTVLKVEFAKQPKEYQNKINIYNHMFRDESHTIDFKKE